MARRRLPIGIQTFREIRQGNDDCVDNTGFALRLKAEGEYSHDLTDRLRPALARADS
ncbi:MAG: hypothetical protein GVY22_17660 [Gammaproteobacteria bacterium]|jgi:hypothetical protein|nr:hypothetical protein [Gammaproteobacteria bacterium]